MKRYKPLFKENIEDVVKGIFDDKNDCSELFDYVDNFNEKHIAGALQKQLIGTLGDVQVYTVNGDYVKLNWFKDFTEGGNSMAYDWIPENEIWLDQNITSAEYKYILLHEYVEWWLMKNKGMEYDNSEVGDDEDLKYAHPNANKIEMDYRKFRLKK